MRSEDVAQFDYRPVACRKAYRMVVVRKNLTIEKGGRALFVDIRYFFYIMNDWITPAEEINRLLGEPALQSRELDRAAEERSSRAADAGGQLGKQLGLHGDGLGGLDVEGVVCVAAPRGWSLG